MATKYTQLQAEVIYILENQKLGAVPRFTTWTYDIAGNSSATHTFEINPQSYWKINKIVLSGAPDTFYTTIIVDGQRDKDGNPMVERQLLRENNSTLELKTPILAREKIYVKAENGTSTTSTFSITIFYTEYDRLAIDKFRQELGF